MRRTLIIILVVVLLVLAIWLIFFNKNTSNKSSNSSSNNTTTLLTPNGSNGSTNPSPTGPTVNASIQNITFTTPDMTVKKGTTIVWTNFDSVQHTVTSDTGNELNSPDLNNGDTYSHTFNTVGTFKYHCKYHPTMMTGTITVTN